MRMCNAESQKRSAKCSNFKDYNRALPSQELLLYGKGVAAHSEPPAMQKQKLQNYHTRLIQGDRNNIIGQLTVRVQKPEASVFGVSKPYRFKNFFFYYNEIGFRQESDILAHFSYSAIELCQNDAETTNSILYLNVESRYVERKNNVEWLKTKHQPPPNNVQIANPAYSNTK